MRRSGRLVLAAVRPGRPHAAPGAAAAARGRVRRLIAWSTTGSTIPGPCRSSSPGPTLAPPAARATRPVAGGGSGRLVARQVELHRRRLRRRARRSASRTSRRSISAPCARSRPARGWVGPPGPGPGREMRQAILHLAFAGLGAEEALSGAFEDNVCLAGHVACRRLRRERRDASCATAPAIGSHRPIRSVATSGRARGATTSRSSGSSVPRHVHRPHVG